MLQGFFRIERFGGGRAGGGRAKAAQAKGQNFWAGKAPRPELMGARAPGGAVPGGAAQGKGRNSWAGKAPRPELMPAGMRGPAVQAKGACASPSMWPGAPRPDLLPGMGRPKPEMLDGVAQRRDAGGAGVVTSPVLDGRLRLIGPGKPLDAGTRERMEGFFGADFSGVRVHEGPVVQAMGALAFTLGEALCFAPGLYDPTTREGIELLGHELTHVVQQRDGPPPVSDPHHCADAHQVEVSFRR